MSDFVTLVNNTPKPLRTRTADGTPITFAPAGHGGSSVPVTRATAAYIQENLGDLVSVLTTVRPASYMERQVQRSFWIANMSGDPDAPDTFTETFQEGVDGKARDVSVRNELKQPQTYKARLGRFHGITPPGTHWCKQADGSMGWNTMPMQVTLPGKVITIPPYNCVEVNEGQFETLLRLDSELPPHKRGHLIAGRAPSDFEPNMDDPFWTLDNQRLWLELTPATDEKEAGAFVMGPSEAELRAKHPDASEDEWLAILHEARLAVWKRCRLRALDPQFDIPTKKEFDMAKARRSKSEKSK